MNPVNTLDEINTKICDAMFYLFHTISPRDWDSQNRVFILVVDDKADNRAILVDILGSLNFTVIEAENGEDGLIQLTTSKPDAIIVDLVMPYQIYALCKRDGNDFNLAWIPSDFTAEPNEMFDPVYMKKLFDRGYQMALHGYPWQKAPPGYILPE